MQPRPYQSVFEERFPSSHERVWVGGGSLVSGLVWLLICQSLLAVLVGIVRVLIIVLLLLLIIVVVVLLILTVVVLLILPVEISCVLLPVIVLSSRPLRLILISLIFSLLTILVACEAICVHAYLIFVWRFVGV